METTLPVLIDLFAATKQTEGKSRKTVEWYRQMLSRFADWAGPVPIKDLSVDTARDFVGTLQAQQGRWNNHPHRPASDGKLSPMTIHGYVRALRAFSSWLVDDGFTKADIFGRLKRPKVPATMIEVLTEEEINHLFSLINPNCALGARLDVICLLLLDTGIRASELVTLKVEHTYLDQSCIKVYGKGAKERIVPFGAITKKSLLRYTNTWREPLHDGVQELILATDGTSLTYSGLHHIIRRLAKRAGIARLHPHLFRHTFAVRYLMNGGDLASLKMMLGHTTLAVTELYLHLASQHIQVQHRRFSPVDRLGISRRKRGSRAR